MARTGRRGACLRTDGATGPRRVAGAHSLRPGGQPRGGQRQPAGYGGDGAAGGAFAAGSVDRFGPGDGGRGLRAVGGSADADRHDWADVRLLRSHRHYAECGRARQRAGGYDRRSVGARRPAGLHRPGQSLPPGTPCLHGCDVRSEPHPGRTGARRGDPTVLRHCRRQYGRDDQLLGAARRQGGGLRGAQRCRPQAAARGHSGIRAVPHTGHRRRQSRYDQQRARLFRRPVSDDIRPAGGRPGVARSPRRRLKTCHAVDAAAMGLSVRREAIRRLPVARRTAEADETHGFDDAERVLPRRIPGVRREVSLEGRVGAHVGPIVRHRDVDVHHARAGGAAPRPVV